MKEVVGVCIGASTVSFVKIKKDDDGNIDINDRLSITHNGNPKSTFYKNLKEFNSEKLPTVVTGRKFRHLVKLTKISEPEATEYAVSYTSGSGRDFSAVASLGGETFLVYPLDGNGKITNVIAKNQCASGTGEFFLQQIRRMNLNLDETIDIARNSNPFKVSGRCSVFCKSDCTHALNKGTPKGEVASGLALMVAEKIEELLKKVKGDGFLLIGGVTQNDIVIDFLKKKFDNIYIPKESPYFEALGAAIYGLSHEIEPIHDFEKILIDKESSFVFHEPLEKFKDMVKFKSISYGKASDGDRCILGLDVGSTTTKAVIIRVDDNEILGSVYLYTNGNPIRASRECYSELLKQVPENINLIGIGATGSGRQIAGLHALTDGVINEIIAHATAAIYFDSEVDTIFEIGGQDAKYTYIVNKVAADYAMNEACSAGTGSFIEESAHESLGINVKDIEGIALKGKRPPNFNDQCAAFIGSDIKTALQENIDKEDVVAGLVYSICMNYINRVKGNRQIGNKIFMQGGVCYNKAIPIAMAALTGKEIVVPPEPGLMGAFGVALEVKDKIKLGFIQEKQFSLRELADREVTYKKPFVCMGGREKCDIRCEVNLIEVEGKTYPFGGACNKYYNLQFSKKIKIDEFDFVQKRYSLTFDKYISKIELPENAKTVGINLSFHTHTIYPLYHNFFTRLGFKVVLPDEVDAEGIERETTAYCYPGQLSLGLFQDLLKKNPDYFFVPNLIEMFVDNSEYQKIDNNCSCIFVSGEPYYLKQTFKDYELNGRLITPILNFGNGYESEENCFS